MKKTYFLFFILMLIIFLFVVEKERKTYVIKVQDGDSIILSNGSKIRLFGIDAPELFQTCITKDKKEIECGKISQKILENFIFGKRSSL